MRLEQAPLASAMIREIDDRPQQFHELVDAHREVPWPEFPRAWGELRQAAVLSRDDDGNYLNPHDQANQRDSMHRLQHELSRRPGPIFASNFMMKTRNLTDRYRRLMPTTSSVLAMLA
jgi:hypothetical protein